MTDAPNSEKLLTWADIQHRTDYVRAQRNNAIVAAVAAAGSFSILCESLRSRHVGWDLIHVIIMPYLAADAWRYWKTAKMVDSGNMDVPELGSKGTRAQPYVYFSKTPAIPWMISSFALILATILIVGTEIVVTILAATSVKWHLAASDIEHGAFGLAIMFAFIAYLVYSWRSVLSDVREQRPVKYGFRMND